MHTTYIINANKFNIVWKWNFNKNLSPISYENCMCCQVVIIIIIGKRRQWGLKLACLWGTHLIHPLYHVPSSIASVRLTMIHYHQKEVSRNFLNGKKEKFVN